MTTETITIEAPPENADPAGWRVGQYYTLMVEALRAQYEGGYWDTSEGARLKRAALKLYEQRNPHGSESMRDTIMITVPGPQLAEIAKNQYGVALRGPFAPFWAMYLREARAMLALADEVGAENG
jgi:hypothetical protein